MALFSLQQKVPKEITLGNVARCERVHLANWRSNPTILANEAKTVFWKEAWCEVCGRHWFEQWMGT